MSEQCAENERAEKANVAGQQHQETGGKEHDKRAAAVRREVFTSACFQSTTLILGTPD